MGIELASRVVTDELERPAEQAAFGVDVSNLD
jgi:hypothetical protein